MPEGPGRVIELRVAEVIHETADAHSFVLEPVDSDESRLSYRPGQFLTVRIPTERRTGAARCYSLCSSPATGEPLKITVKRTVGGYASNWLCDNVRPGATLEVLRPSGTFTPRSFEGQLVLLAAGSGITPIMSIAKSVLHAGTGTVLLVYANRDENSVIFAAELAELASRFPDRLTTVHWLESTQGLPTGEALSSLLAGCYGASAFLCGPAPFMDVAVMALRQAGVPERRIHREPYLSLDSDPFAGPDPGPSGRDGGEAADPTAATVVTATFEGVTSTHAWPAGAYLLDVLLADGMDVPYSCREGRCSACACRLVEGVVEMDNNEILGEDDLEDGLILACQSRARTAEVRVLYDV